MNDDSIRKLLVRLGLALLVVGVGTIFFKLSHRQSPGSVPQTLQREFKELSVEATGRALAEPSSLTQEQLDSMLYTSAAHASPAMVGWLLQRGASPRARGASHRDRSALQEAARHGRCESEKTLIGRVEELARASTGGPADKVPALVAQQVALFVNESDSHYSSPLHEAVEGGKRECVATLLAAGARVDAHDSQGVTPLNVARQKEFNHLVPMLSSALVEQGGIDDLLPRVGALFK